LARFHREAAPRISEAAALIANRFPRTRKNSSGYALDAYLGSRDVIDLVIGAEGTLGIIIEIEWRLDLQPAGRAGLRVWLRSLDDLYPVVTALAPARPSAVELLDRSFLDLIEPTALAQAGISDSQSEAVLLVELESSDPLSLPDEVDQAVARVQGVALSVEAAGSALAAERLWGVRHAASPILANLPESQRSLQVIEDGCVPLDRMSEYIRTVRAAAGRCRIPAVMFGHAGDGHIHVNLLPDVTRPGWEEEIRTLLEEVNETVARLGGTLSGEHGDGRLRAQSLNRLYGAEIVELFRKVKQSFDPLGIFNPGVILSSGDPPISHLKVGASAVALPPDLELSLREIERKGNYARSRLELADEKSGVASQGSPPPD
jgi:FAD/FMN-containing dehydrogenase